MHLGGRKVAPQAQERGIPKNWVAEIVMQIDPRKGRKILMNGIEAFPLSWPAGRPRKRSPSRAQFSEVSFARARDEVMHQLRLLRVERPILSTNIPLRRDGLAMAATAQPQDRGVAVYFKYKGKPMVFACDQWDKIEHNLWAIAKTIDALRGIERWGSGEMLEQAFSGFQALPAPSKSRGWREVLGYGPSFRPIGPELEERFRSLAKQNHPDLGGDHGRMAEINAAYQTARKELGL